MKKKVLIFGIIYLVLFILMSLLIFSWNAFGGSKSTNFIQKAITFFFAFPSYLNILGIKNICLFPLINTLFWTAIFYLCLLLFYKLNKKR